MEERKDILGHLPNFEVDTHVSSLLIVSKPKIGIYDSQRIPSFSSSVSGCRYCMDAGTLAFPEL